jgi:glutathione S-transferase
MKPSIVIDLSNESLLIHWLVLEKECPLDVKYQEYADTVKAPYYVDGDILIYDLQTLIQFLQERYPGELLLPGNPISRAQIRQACTLIGEPDVDVFAEVKACLDTGSKYLAGNEFSLLDIYVGVWLNENYTPDNSSVRSYWERISNRPAFRIAEDG